jgi:hypothetical protein
VTGRTSRLKWAAIGLAVVAVGIQAIRPARTNPAIDEKQTLQANATLTPEVSAIFARSCQDCHSSKTVWPWYSQIAPVSWLLTDDVNGGRRKWSASEWGTYDAKKRARVRQQMCEEVMGGDMPPSTYLLMHHAARLADPDKKAICDWANSVQ